MRLPLALLLAATAAWSAACAATDDVTVDQEPDAQSTPVQSTPVDPFDSVEADCGSPVTPGEAQPGVRQAIAGTVTGTSIARDERGNAVILEVAAEGGAPFAVAIPEDALSNFRGDPMDTYDGREVCVRGVVQDYRGIPTIFVTLPTEITGPE